MSASKRYKGKDCAYCGGLRISSTNDHVVARSFFLDVDRADLDLPQVAACGRCNNEKSKLEIYVGSSLLIGSEHLEANRYRWEKVRRRLERNQRLCNELNLGGPPEWVRVNGILQLRKVVKVDRDKVETLLQMIVRGLYRYHYGKPLSRDMWPHVQMIRPAAEAAMWASVADYFPNNVPRIRGHFGIKVDRSGIGVGWPGQM